MPSTYTTNLGIEKIGTGEQAGSWGTTTNINFDIIDQAVNGVVAVSIAGTGTSGSPNTLTNDDGAVSDGRNFSIELTGSPGGSAYIRLDPNDAEKIGYIKNSFGDSSSAIIFQGTYNASNDYVLAAGYGAFLKFDGAGASAVVTNLLQNHVVDGTLLAGGVTVDTGGTLDISGGTLTLANDQISGNSIDGGTISNFSSTGIDDNATGIEITVTDASVTFGGNIVLSEALATVDGRDVSVDGAKLDGIDSNANNYTLPAATSTALGGVELFSDTVQTVAANAVSSTSGKTYGIQLNSDGQAVVNVPWSDTTGSTDLGATADGTSLTITSSTGSDASVPAATTSAWGAMTDEDKTKLDGIAPGATANTGTVTSVSGGTGLSGSVTTSGNIDLYSSVDTGGSTTLSDEQFRTVTSATQTITLPASPAAGDTVYISVGSATDTVVGRNGSNISGLAEDMTIDVANVGITLVYSGDATQGWRLM